MSDSLQSYRLQQSRLSCPSWTPGAFSKSCPLSQWYHTSISSSVIPFFSCPQSFPAAGFFPMNQIFASAGQSIRALASASVLPMNIKGWFPLGLTGVTSLVSKVLSRVFSSTTIRKHQFFGPLVQFLDPSSGSKSHIHMTTRKNCRYYYMNLCQQSDISVF